MDIYNVITIFLIIWLFIGFLTAILRFSQLRKHKPEGQVSQSGQLSLFALFILGILIWPKLLATVYIDYKNLRYPVKHAIADPFTILPSCMGDICNQLVKHFSDEQYKWNEKEEVKTFECLILSKFLMDHALITTFHEKIDEIRIDFYLEMLDSIFKSLLNRTFPNLETSDIVKNRLALYSNIMSENPHPRCWQ